ncbi:hypothetical protein ADICEAN_00097 [Cesiribacter andamanensis AMV16]|uniref:DUF1343 domain-containing protein n=1 Tax=Cesiribacter andamanensis AMV16 TaxID=1279009 RepID=M7NCE4_9BACT|nr:hypothetical protein ADICEAN_00097 [Cesiribacter andamanensis AMV16]
MMQQIELFGKFWRLFLRGSHLRGILMRGIHLRGSLTPLRSSLLLTALLPGMALASCSTNAPKAGTATPDSVFVEIEAPQEPQAAPALLLGAERKDLYLPLLRGKRIGLIVNHTSLVPQPGGEALHLVDLLLKEGLQVKKVFAPEHGFRGTADAGEKILSGTDAQTGLPVVSLYGNNKKPSPEQLQDVDVLVFDIQDVGARFYTYISTMHYTMEAAAEQGKQMVVLDRPNPNGHIIDGPVLDPRFRSFVGMHPIPVVHGLTVGELAQMINGEGWLAGEKKASLTVVPLQGYTHSTPYVLPVRPSPNLPNQQSIYLYPSLCLFEGTPISLGRGTPFPFQVIGYPIRNLASSALPLPQCPVPPTHLLRTANAGGWTCATSRPPSVSILGL